MKIIKITGFEGSEYERLCLTNKITRIIEADNYGWTRIGYKVPRGRKEHRMWILATDVDNFNL